MDADSIGNLSGCFSQFLSPRRRNDPDRGGQVVLAGGGGGGTPLPQEALLAAGGFTGVDQAGRLTVGTTVTHDAVFHDMPGALRVFIDHARRNNFANIRNFTHGDNVLNVRVRTVSV